MGIRGRRQTGEEGSATHMLVDDPEEGGVYLVNLATGERETDEGVIAAWWEVDRQRGAVAPGEVEAVLDWARQRAGWCRHE